MDSRREAPKDTRSPLCAELGALRQRLRSVRAELYRLDGLVPNEAGEIELLTGIVGDSTVALPLRIVERVAAVPELARIPEASFWMAGLMTLHGHDIPVIDVLARMDRQSRRPVLSDIVVVVTAGEGSVGLLMQDASGVWRVRADEIQSLSDEDEVSPFVIGTVHVQDRRGFLLDVARLVACTEEK